MEIGGNDQIVASALSSENKLKSLTTGEPLYESRILTENNRSRQDYLVKADKLLPFIKEAKSAGAEIEHIFDYYARSLIALFHRNPALLNQ